MCKTLLGHMIAELRFRFIEQLEAKRTKGLNPID